MTKHEWVKLPTRWIQDRYLNELRWVPEQGSDNIAALMVLIVLAHYADQSDGNVQRTYNQLETATELSRPKIAAGISLLATWGLIDRAPSGRSSFQLTEFDPAQGWGKLPCKGLYQKERIPFFATFHLRQRAELDALKLLLLIVARRDNSRNQALMTYETIEAYSGIDRNRIRSALTILAVNGLVHVDMVPSTASTFGIVNAYRLAHVDTRRHAGTTGRGADQVTDADLPF